MNRQYLRDLLFVLGDARTELPRIFGWFVFAALLDLCGLGLVIPLITTMASGHGSPGPYPFMTPYVNALGVSSLAVAIALVYVGRAVVAYAVQRRIAQFSETQRGNLMTRLLDAYLRKPYEFHLQHNSSALINSTITLTWAYSMGVLSVCLRLSTDILTFVAIIAFLAWVDWPVVLMVGATMFVILGLYNRMAREVVTRAGQTVAISQESAVRIINHSLGAIREVRVLGVEEHAVSEMRNHASRLSEAAGLSGAIQVMPRYLVETGMIAVLAALAVMAEGGVVDGPDLLPTLGLLGIASVRLMPAVTSILGSLNTLRTYHYAVTQLAAELRVLGDEAHPPTDLDAPPKHARPFERLELANVAYSYPGGAAPALKDVSLTILAGQAMGIIGRSGAGKSTLADVVLGLIVPQQGKVLADGEQIVANPKAWRRKLAYIPQSVFIKDDTVTANVAFGVAPEAVDPVRLQRALTASRLQDVVAALPDGTNTILGERGVRLSGGQRQRVALARALYHDREIIVMDEATAALDSETEREVIQSIRSLHGQKTLIVIAHRLSTLEGCDFVVQLENGRLVRSGSFAEVVARSAGE